MKNKVLIILFIGFLTRILAGYFIYGFIGFDEYFNVIDPAGKWLFGKEALFTWNESIRSPLLAIIVYYIMKFFYLIGIKDPVSLIRFTEMIFGCASFAIAVYIFKKLPGRAYYAAVFYFVFPFIDTRIMFESVSAVLVLYALYTFHCSLKENKPYAMILAALAVGLASMIRVQVGVIYIGMLVSFLFYRPFKKKTIFIFLAASLVPLFFQFLIDYIFFKGFFSSLLNYIHFQAQFISAYDNQKWYNFILLFFALSLPPATAIFAPALYKSAKKYPCFIISFILFFVFHTLSPHKEERFMFPVIYVFVFMIAASYYDVRDWFYNWDRPKFFKYMITYAVIINFILLIPAMFSNTISNVTDPLSMLGRQNDLKGVISDSPIIPSFYLAYKGKIKIEHDLLQISKNDFKNYNYVLSLNPANTEKLLSKYPELKFVRIFESGIVDRIVYYLNPSKNARRRYGVLLVVQ